METALSMNNSNHFCKVMAIATLAFFGRQVVSIFAAPSVCERPLLTWRNPLPQGNSLYSVVWANGSFVAVGEPRGTTLYSRTGVEWTSPAPVCSDPLFG